MTLITIIAIIIVAFILEFLKKRYVKLSMVISTIIFIGLIVLVDSVLFFVVFFSGILEKIPLIVKLIIIVISIAPFVCIKGHIAHTIRILDYWIHKNKILEMGYIEKGIIKEIKSYSLFKDATDGYYLIVDFNGEKIKSLPFRYNPGATIVRTTYRNVYSNGKLNREKVEEVLGDMPQLYNVGDEIDVIIYHNKKYIKLKEDKMNKYVWWKECKIEICFQV